MGAILGFQYVEIGLGLTVLLSDLQKFAAVPACQVRMGLFAQSTIYGFQLTFRDMTAVDELPDNIVRQKITFHHLRQQ